MDPTPERVVYRAGAGSSVAADADPITAEVIRHGLNAAADRMKRALVRTAVTPVIYEVLDFAVAIYDHEVRLLAQAPSLPLFMGTLNFCVEGVIEAVGGVEQLEPGDIVLYNVPYAAGSHPQDTAVVMPIFLPGRELVGYAAIKAHWMDLGGKDPYSTDTVDLFQEGTVFPGVKLYSRGELVTDVYRIVLANTRVPRQIAGDLHGEVVGVRAAADALVALVQRHGLETFRSCVERMFDHGEAVVRSYIEQLPDGRYVGRGTLDDDGLTDEPVPFDVVLEIEGSNVRLDYSGAPDARSGPMNCPFPSTVSASRLAICALAGGGDSPHEGQFRPLEIVARPGSIFHPLSPSPCFLFIWPALQAIEAVYNAVAQAMPDRVPAASGGCLCGVNWWGRRRDTEEPWADGSPHPVGQGAHARGDGGSSMMHLSEAATRFSPIELWESKYPWLMEKVELAPDSCGPGRFRGGLGVDFHFELTEDAYLTSIIDRTKNAPWGLAGGGQGRPNGGLVRLADGSRRRIAKATRVHVPAGAVVELHTGGGGGYGAPADRDRQAVLADVREGYITEEHARRHYPHAFA